MKRIAFTFCILFYCFSIHAQIFNMLNEDLYKGRVKLISEFMSRFNGDELNPYIDPSSAEVEKVNLCQLFDAEYILKNREQVEKEAFQFIDSIQSHTVKLHYSDMNWFAKVSCVGTFKNKETNFTLYLTVEQRGKDMYKWVIAGVEGRIFNLAPSRMSDKIMLLPNEHESNFMRLNSITDEKDDYISIYSSKYNPINTLSVFDALVYYGFLNIEYVSNIEYCFLQVPGYVFTIKEFDRESTNSGWLISTWEQMTSENKKLLLDNLYNGRYEDALTDSTKGMKAISENEIITNPDAVGMINNFISRINLYLSDKSQQNLLQVEECVNGRYTFIISDTLCDELCKLNGAKSQKSYRLKEFLNWLSNSKSPYKKLQVDDLEIFNNEFIKKEYSNGYTLVSANLLAEGLKSSIQEKVVFFIYENQIAGVKLITECF